MEDRKESKIENMKSNLTLENRAKLVLDGVVEVIRFNEEEIILNTNIGGLTIKGEELKMNKLDVQNGDVIITGKINSCIYTSNKKDKEKNSIFSKLFR